MGWILDVSPAVHEVTIQPAKDRGTPVADGTQADGALRTVPMHVEPRSAEWNARNGLPIESQIFFLATDQPDDVRAVVKGDRLSIPTLGVELVAMNRATVAAVADYPSAELLAEIQTQGGRR